MKLKELMKEESDLPTTVIDGFVQVRIKKKELFRMILSRILEKKKIHEFNEDTTYRAQKIIDSFAEGKEAVQNYLLLFLLA